jgi:hypothetical protein
MPGKVNPVIPEVVNQVCFQIIGADIAISMACEASELELNMAEPIIAFNLFLVSRCCAALRSYLTRAASPALKPTANAASPRSKILSASLPPSAGKKLIKDARTPPAHPPAAGAREPIIKRVSESLGARKTSVIPSAKLGLLGQRHGFDRCNRSQSLRSGKNRSENDESQADNAKQAAGGAGYAGPCRPDTVVGNFSAGKQPEE